MTPYCWLSFEAPARNSAIEGRCTKENVQSTIAHIGDVQVTSVTINSSGQFQVPPAAPYDYFPAGGVIGDLPDYCDVRVETVTPGGHIARFIVWVPLDWNERFLGTGGHGMRTLLPWMELDILRGVTMPMALRNGFATATTDAVIRDPRFGAYALNEETRELDWELLRNWSYRSTHDMTLIGKAVTEAIHANAPRCGRRSHRFLGHR